MPDHDIVTKAIWNSTTQFVEIVFDTKDMSKEEIENIIKEIIGDDKADFVIEGFEVNKDTGETKVIIKFTDTEKAENFVETIKNSSGSTKNLIKNIEYCYGSPGSFSANLFISTSFFGLNFVLLLIGRIRKDKAL